MHNVQYIDSLFACYSVGGVSRPRLDVCRLIGRHGRTDWKWLQSEKLLSNATLRLAFLSNKMPFPPSFHSPFGFIEEGGGENPLLVVDTYRIDD